MIPVLILYLVNKLKKASFFSKRIAKIKRLATRLGMLLAFLFLVAFTSSDSDLPNVLSYNVIRDSEVIGNIQIQRQLEGDSIIYTLESKISAKFIWSIDIEGQETSVFEKDKLIFSSVYRQVNKKVKADHEIVFKDSKYIINSGNKSEFLQFEKIKTNLITLYFKEPLGISQVFCDNEKRMVSVTQKEKGVYKVLFSNGKYNLFYYKDGKCIMVKANSKLFSVQLIPA